MKESKDKVLEITNLSFSYDGKLDVISNCSFKINEGNICAIVGESGSGKSTLLRLIAGLERPRNGTIEIKNKMVSNESYISPPQNRNVGLVFQDFALFPHLTVKENISYGLKKDEKKITQEMLKTIKLEEFANRYPAEISGGQEQRVSIARTLALKPSLLLLDEPFSSLDNSLKNELRKEIKHIVRDLKTSLIFITHDIIDALDIADEIIFLKDGMIIKHSLTNDIYKNIENKFIEKSRSELSYNTEIIKRAIS